MRFNVIRTFTSLLILALSVPLFAQDKVTLYQDGKPFTATQFLEAVVDRYPRPKSWPERLTFKEIKMSEKEAFAELIGEWRVSYACSGRVLDGEITKKEIDGWRPSSGIVVPLATMTFAENQTYTFRSIGFIDQVRAGKPNLKPISKEKNFKILVKEDKIILLASGALTYQLKPVRIQETRENAFLSVVDNPWEQHGSDETYCNQGEKFEILFSRDEVPTT